MTDILLTTLNAKYIHTAFGLRYLKSNMLDLEDKCEILEFTIQQDPALILEALVQRKPKIVGFGVYIWNVKQIQCVLERLRVVAPEIIVVLGGPEISYATEAHPLWGLANYVVTQEGEVSFYQLAKKLLNGQKPLLKVVAGELPAVQHMNLPYALYSDEDLQNRILYVEASRGCPFKCEFCLSSLDQKVRAFELDRFLGEMDKLWQRGARQFKFVDRTFNLSSKTCIAILQFFYERYETGTFLHFEMIPDRLPEAIKEWITKFPAGAIQFEIGIQTLNPEVAARISRKQDYEKTRANFDFLTKETGVHIHADLILGLPGETLESIATGFDELLAMNPHEIQVGILKRLPGTPIARHSEDFDMRFNPATPYEILSNNTLSFETVNRLKRFARYFDAFINSGHFKTTWAWFCQRETPFHTWLNFSDWLYQKTGQTHKLSMTNRANYLYEFLTVVSQVAHEEASQLIQADLRRNKHKGVPSFLQTTRTDKKRPARAVADRRQRRHQNVTTEAAPAG
ncbi:MAG: B12-binding domain-containing radical SAM protein [Myxococcales bacterium]|nr:B12-binding domain-containing radical SAM protein [Myxococcales bacterium]|tara:strand:- start:1766 stop:3304 length:1539 start_codon:yes stop_codon:yes gene_type:complete